MKVQTERRTSDASHYSPYPPTSTFAPPAPPRPNPPSRTSTSETPTPTPGPDDSTQYKVARAISSCTRCRSRKQKCDGKLPACSACERAKVECIGFDAISKTNVSRNYLHSLEQEVASLRAQVTALTNNDHIGNHKRSIAANASVAIANYRPDSLAIDPTLTSNSSEHDMPLRSPWDSPSFNHNHSSLNNNHARRLSDFPFPPPGPTPGSAGTDGSRSPFMAGRSAYPASASNIHATSLTRMVHDAALRTGHASLNNSTMNPPGPSSSAATNSERGSVVGNDSPAALDTGDGLATSPDVIPTPKSTGNSASKDHRPPTASPLNTSASLTSGNSGKSKRRTFTIPPLPPQAAVERLVAAYVDFVGVTAPIIHIPTLGKQLIKIREGTDVDESDVFVVMMVLALSTMASSRFVDPPDELRACSEAFHAEAMKHLDAVFEEQSYVGLQAILLLVWYSLLNPEKGSIWFLVGLASRTCVDLGFHNEHNAQVEQLDVLELDMRRRLFWVTYKMDRLLSQALGRPPSIPDGFINVPLPSPLHDVDIHADQYGPLTGEPCSYKAVFVHTIKCRQLQSEILNNTYGIHGGGDLPSPAWFEDCFERLKQWLATTPEPRGTMSAEGYAISFHNSALLLCRPSPGNPRPDRKALATVLASSSYIIRIYRRMQLNNRISWLWMTSHFTFMAGLSFLYAFFNLYSTGGGPGVPTLEEAMMDIESCMAVLEYLSPRVPSAIACHETMRSVSQAILEQLGKTEPPPSATSPRSILRGAPISSSRDDPLPNEAFPAPLPPITLPYELSLLDNLFLNPMAPHNKASDYTNGCKNRNKAIANEVRSNFVQNVSNASYGAPPQGFPPGVFQTSFPDGLAGGMAGIGAGLGPYGMAAQVSTPIATASLVGSMLNQDTQTQATNGDAQTTMESGFDIFNFLMDEEGLGGTTNWDALEVPADMSLWS